ncbi:hypothetical protein KP509_01G004900 [Ceratopteris richardii]|uniref:Uncharacterized protein n=1 Tax=Ceratopteris richardii TaxID=49495 RepID=A0A8T2VLN7_CERRI|nr:hypothetical protein KP509_01G004900 [Ceratopteris richardii]
MSYGDQGLSLSLSCRYAQASANPPHDLPVVLTSTSLFFGVNLLSECRRMVIGILCSMARPHHAQSKLKMIACGSMKAVRTTKGGAQTSAGFLLWNKEPFIDALWLDTVATIRLRKPFDGHL